ncbi:MAG: hypothetical protein INQ03_03665 [Candidatus Heimdallarchaeota archaeon]|nr:hypothetical protein [Candidatus Heimdallarchaeota archaeon]
MTDYISKEYLSFLLGSSSLVLFLMTISSLLGILIPDKIYPSDYLASSFLPNDVVNLSIILPIFLYCLYSLKSGKLLGILSLPGALLYTVYIYSIYFIGTTGGIIRILYLFLITISIYSLIFYITQCNFESIVSKMEGVNHRLISLLLISIAGIFMLRQIVVMFSPQDVDIVLNGQLFGDFVVFGASMLLGGYLLWKQNALGYIASTGLLLFCCISFLALVPFMIIQASMNDMPVDWGGIIFVLFFGMIAFVPFTKYYILGLRKVEFN